ncbi:MAG: hypothetical protein Q4A21_03510 [bacterium]|nr:hypothetical protein [bacterium]
MKKGIIILATILMSGIGMVSVPALATGGSSAPTTNSAAKSAIDGVNSTGTSSSTNVNGIIKTVVGVMMFILGALSVIMIIYSGIQYVISAGDSGKITKAKNTLIYSIVGLVVAIFAYAIVNFVLTELGK